MKSRDEKSKSVGVITGGTSSSACTLFGNGASVVSGNGKMIYTAPDGKKTVHDGYGYSASKVYKEDGKDYDVVVKVRR
jgi:hypothetical protein